MNSNALTMIIYVISHMSISHVYQASLLKSDFIRKLRLKTLTC